MNDLYEFLFYVRMAFVHAITCFFFAGMAVDTSAIASALICWIIAAGFTGYVFIYLYEVFYMAFVHGKILYRKIHYRLKEKANG